ncbi:MAG TPA: transcription-repair coupling factor, partial [bacterium]|nr:transcription-repair coupling factor [bacterium]
MLSKVLKSFIYHPSLQYVTEALYSKGAATVHGLSGSSSAFFASALLGKDALKPDRSILAILPDEEESEAFRGDVEDILGSESVISFPERDTSPYEHIDSHFEVRSQRMETLEFLERGWHGIVVSTISALHDPTTPPGLINLVSFEVNKGQRINFEDFIISLTGKGFSRKNSVTSPGQVAVRGGIVDIFPFGGEIPYRVEFLGDEVESIRTFSTSSQRSLECVDGFRIIPPDEFITEAGINSSDEHRIMDIENKAGINLDKIKIALTGGERPNGVEQYLYVVFGAQASLCSYFSSDDIVLIFDPEMCKDKVDKKLNHAFTIWERQKNDDPDIPPPEYFFMSSNELMNSFEKLLCIKNYYLRPTGFKSINFNIQSSRHYQGNLDELKKDIQKAQMERIKCHIACDNSGQAERLRELLEEIEGYYAMDVARLSGGFTDPATRIAIFTDHEIFGRHLRRVKYRHYKDGVPIPDHRALTLGDYVVHVDYGIGRYMGLKRINAGGAETDCLLIRYKGDDKLFVPVEQLKRLKKFSADEGIVPVINKLGGTSWEKLKARTKKSIQRMAKDLLQLYAERKAFMGNAFTFDKHMMSSMEESFVYEETPDQLRAWSEVKKDMESSSPMERLICGDVGFGKTEIAIRAAFMAVLNNKQVAILVPTTILAEQHEETFKERLADFPVSIAAISRFRSKKEQKDIIDRLAAGRIDIIIGTHRLLSTDVYIKNLGILIVDEEQRFGVRSKERIKKLRSNIDVISMSATPIPRTLNMSLLGARDISFINTPPPDRYSVHSEVVPFEEKYVTEAILREIDRDGQVFFVHNRVRSIESMASYLRKLIPGVTFCVVHGQLPEKELETRMRDFYHRKYQVLVTTMIIESGLDIPTVNTILINRADTFGLSQLYQLRGRVGRSNIRAYAYLLVPPKMTLTKTARQRLRTIEEFSELGSGFNIAMRDLEFRGAGNILGTEQSGYIAAVGFDLYTDLLHETIAELKGEKVSKPPEVEIHTKRDSYFPEKYIPDAQERVLFYRRLSETVSPDEVKAIEEELTDRFGRFEEPVSNLIETAYLRHYAALIGASEVSINTDKVGIFIPDN